MLLWESRGGYHNSRALNLFIKIKDPSPSRKFHWPSEKVRVNICRLCDFENFINNSPLTALFCGAAFRSALLGEIPALAKKSLPTIKKWFLDKFEIVEFSKSGESLPVPKVAIY